MKFCQRIAIIQPAIPKYRKDFFDELRKEADIHIYTTKRDFLDVKSIDNLDYAKYQENFKCVFGLYWHKGLPIMHITKNFDIIVINGNLRIINYMILLTLAKCYKKEVIWWGHLNSAGRYGILPKIRMQLMRIASKRLLYTENEYLRYKYKSNTHYLNNGLKSDKPLPHKPIAVFNKERRLKVVFIGRLTRKSNIEFALNCLKYSDIDLTFDIIGGGSNYAKLKSEYGSSRFQFHGEITDNKKIREIVSSAQLFLYPGAVGLSLIHGFNLGLAAIVHNNEKNHMPEYSAFKNGFNGIYFRENDVSSLENALCTYMALEQSEKYQLHINALNTTKYSYNIDDMVCRFMNCLRAKYK